MAQSTSLVFNGGAIPSPAPDPGERISIDSPDESIIVNPHVDPNTGVLVYSLSSNIVEMTTDEVTEITNDFN